MLLARKLISEEDLHLFKVTNSVEEAVAEIVNFYRVYHSMRLRAKATWCCGCNARSASRR